MQGKNSGVTLIELVISMAILAVLGTAIGSFLYMGIKQYHMASSEVSVQTEAQMVQNQLQNLLLAASKGIWQGTDGLEIYNYNEDAGKKEKITVSYEDEEEELLYTRYYWDESENRWKVDEGAANENLASYVKDFSVKLYDSENHLLEAPNAGRTIERIEISVSYQLESRSYKSDFVLTPRNSLIFSNEMTELFD